MHSVTFSNVPQYSALEHQTTVIKGIEARHQHRAIRIINDDLIERSLPGIFAYLAVWLVIAVPAINYFADNSAYLIQMSVLIFIAAAFRLSMFTLHRTLIKQHQHLITWPLGAGIIVSSLTWGGVTAAIIVHEHYAEIVFALLLCSAGVSAGGGAVLAASRFYSLTLIYLSLAPPTIALLFSDLPFANAVSGICLIYLLTIHLVVYTLRKQYLAALRIRFELETQKESLALLSTLDPMTQLRNKRYFNERLDEEFRRCLRESNISSLILLDIDHFKSINDNYGHLIGDESLKHVASLIQAQFNRATDIVGRVGGEEFAILLPGVTNQEAMDLADALRTNIMHTPVDTEQACIALTASLGVATMRAQSDGKPEDLFSRCDRALYEAKASGRNQVVNSPIVDIPKPRSWAARAIKHKLHEHS